MHNSGSNPDGVTSDTTEKPVNFVSIQFDVYEDKWVIDEDASVWPEDYVGGGGPFYMGAHESGLRWENLDKVQRYQFRVVYDQGGQVKGLRFLGTEARWGEFVPATADQLVLRHPV